MEIADNSGRPLFMFGRYIIACIRLVLKSSWGAANSLCGAVMIVLATHWQKAISLFKDAPSSDFYNSIVTLVVYTIGAWVLILIAASVFLSPFLLWKKAQQIIKDLQKVDDADLEHLLGGRFIGNTFLYKAELILCLQRKGKLEIDQLKNNFTDIQVHAPKNSWARINIRLSNGHQNPQAKCYFYYRDPEGRAVLIDDVYKDLEIYLDEKSSFALKLDYDEGYTIFDGAELRVSVDSWSK